MNKDAFWNLIEASRQGTSDCSEQTGRLKESLQSLDPSEILDFEREMWARMSESYRWDLWAVAFIINGGCSDDGFDYFRGWLVSQGRQYFETALQTPDSAAERADSDANECEDILYAAASVYKQRTGEYPPISDCMPKDGPAGTPWTEDELETLYPALCERFS